MSEVKTVTITDEQKKWLDDHEEINLSGLVRVWLNNYIKKHSNGATFSDPSEEKIKS